MAQCNALLNVGQGGCVFLLKYKYCTVLICTYKSYDICECVVFVNRPIGSIEATSKAEHFSEGSRQFEEYFCDETLCGAVSRVPVHLIEYNSGVLILQMRFSSSQAAICNIIATGQTTSTAVQDVHVSETSTWPVVTAEQVTYSRVCV